MNSELIFTPSDFVAYLNQTLETAYSSVIIEGELSGFRIAKNRWVYFDLKDETAKVSFFGTVFQLPGPLQDGLILRARGLPRIHPRFGFNINLISAVPVGEGSLKKTELLLKRKLEAEGLFAPERKRPLPQLPERVALVTAANSAAYADFFKILNSRWGGVEVSTLDVYVQGEQAPLQLAGAVELLNKLSNLPEVIVVTRGGGSAEDLAAFNDERVVRAVAASRVPTLIAIGHETDESLAELAADARASTPSAAAALLVPDRTHELANLKGLKQSLATQLKNLYSAQANLAKQLSSDFKNSITNLLLAERERLAAARRLVALLDPRAALKRGYALVSKDGKHVRSIRGIKINDRLNLQLSDGKIHSKVTQVSKNA